MRKIQQFFAVVVLTFALALSAFAGEISCPGITSSPSSQQTSIAGDIGTPGSSATGDIQFPGVDALDPATEAALSLLQGLLSLF
ncbi:MAG TPA: hypothetical protein VGC87_26610 [Pyrinomonadaceae bacterium]|jgi:hypothetical protein